jgi:hypothetical protein
MPATISTIPRPAYVYDEGSDTWFPIGAFSYAFVRTFEFTATAAQVTFTGADDNSNTLTYTTGAVQVYLNGALLTPGDDFTASNGTSIVLTSGAALNDILVVIATGTFQAADTYTQEQINNLIESAGYSPFLLMGA